MLAAAAAAVAAAWASAAAAAAAAEVKEGVELPEEELAVEQAEARMFASATRLAGLQARRPTPTGRAEAVARPVETYPDCGGVPSPAPSPTRGPAPRPVRVASTEFTPFRRVSDP